MEGSGPALFRLVRFWSRRWAQAAEEATAEQSRMVQDIVVLEAVEGAAHLSAEVTVTEVAHQLGIDRSGASRFVSAAEHHGYLERRPSPVDARRVAVTVTAAGSQLLQDSHLYQERVFAQLTASWAPEDARQLGDYLQRLADEIPASTPISKAS